MQIINIDVVFMFIMKTVIFVSFWHIGFLTLVDAANSSCKTDEWACKDGTCINADLKCNGAINCPDGSDEKFLVCSSVIKGYETCKLDDSYRCVYGACVPKNATCNGVRDCADNSDELLLECRNEKTWHNCFYGKHLSSFNDTYLNQYRQECTVNASTCKNGQYLGGTLKCDGKVDCDDGSDEVIESCSDDWIPNCIGRKFKCEYGGCVEVRKVCNGVRDCRDGSDELPELCQLLINPDEWTCKDGNIIDVKLKCNGNVDCPDGSDETFELCRNIECSHGYEACVYGGCVKNSAFCDGVQDCVDNSDELHLDCSNLTNYWAECQLRYNNELKSAKTLADINRVDKLLESCSDAGFNYTYKLCKNGQITDGKKCNGVVDCEDGSDETVEACAGRGCDRGKLLDPNIFFKCLYGGCINRTGLCNKVIDCADGSDELDSVCFEGKCVLPEHPKNGKYTVLAVPNAAPKQVLDQALLVFSCNDRYKLHGTSRYINCLKGSWPHQPPQCLSQCRLVKEPSIIYWCLSRGPLASEPEHECGELVPDGATVRPECRESIYHYTAGLLAFMHCEDGVWDQAVPTCSPHCGLVTQQANHLIINGTSVKKGELPWHAAIYDKKKSPYQQICGGSLVSNTIILSAAHCFWTDLEKQLPTENFAAALGKIYRPWNETHDVDVQKSDIRDIKLPPRFKGAAASFQDDIAIVILATRIEYRTYVLPVCLDFGTEFENQQLITGNKGKVAGWGLTAEDGKASPVLKVTQLPYVDIETCYINSPPSFYVSITSDKFCAGSSTSSALCKGDSGGGLVFPSKGRGGSEERYFLRGVVSTAPRNDHACNAYVHTTFTKISSHRDFILEHWN